MGDAGADAVDELIERHGPALVARALVPLLTERRIQRIEAVLDARLTSVTVVLENLHDPRNGAAALRSVEAFGLAAVHAVDARERFEATPAITIGAERWLDLHRHADFAACAGALRRTGWQLCAMLPDAERELGDLDPARPLALAFGNEHDGLSAEAIAACDGAVRLPMFGFTRSFNLSVSVALAVSQAAARRRAALGAPGDLPAADRARLRARWYAQGVRGADAIVDRFAKAVSGSTR